jgi:hypothetical protein
MSESVSEKHAPHSLSLAYQTYLRHDESEKNHFEDVCQSLRQYVSFAMAHWTNHQYRLHNLPEAQRKVLPKAMKRDTPESNQRAKKYKEAAIGNQFCLDCILRHAGAPQHYPQQVNSNNSSSNGSSSSNSTTKVVDDGQISKVSSILKSLARDWSAEGKAEREMTYGPILNQVKKYLPYDEHSMRARPKICVPGAGTYVRCQVSVVI